MVLTYDWEMGFWSLAQGAGPGGHTGANSTRICCGSLPGVFPLARPAHAPGSHARFCLRFEPCGPARWIIREQSLDLCADLRSRKLHRGSLPWFPKMDCTP